MAPNKAKPSLPKRSGNKKAAPASSKQLPIAHAQFITLEDGTQVPVRIPPGMPAEQAQGIIDFLKANPEAAKGAWSQAQQILQTPGLANAFLGMQTQTNPSKSAAMYEALKDDPELQPVFDEVKANGPEALQKYWDDTELMSKISAKLRNMRVSSQQPADEAANTAAGKGRPGKPASEDISSLHDAAKWGDMAAGQRLLDSGADVNGLNERGVSPLGVAVGFNHKDIVELLLNAGADLQAQDTAGNTVLHYAAGYGRLELTELLLTWGADVNAVNSKKQKPIDVAKLNCEKHVVAFLGKQGGEQ
eukprot:GHRR01011618.1.p1 GENE.GHRR01011618.1~~GHRR01011618.1.p1  ORF type:complete len:304 (+),score=115.86 GHRR01011618.1:124-1035(+)